MGIPASRVYRSVSLEDNDHTRSYLRSFPVGSVLSYRATDVPHALVCGGCTPIGNWNIRSRCQQHLSYQVPQLRQNRPRFAGAKTGLGKQPFVMLSGAALRYDWFSLCESRYDRIPM